MNAPLPERVWRKVSGDCRREEGQDIISLGLASEGALYVVTVLGPEHMSLTQMTDSLRAALYYMLKAGKADPEAIMGIGARVLSPDELDPKGKTN